MFCVQIKILAYRGLVRLILYVFRNIFCLSEAQVQYYLPGEAIGYPTQLRLICLSVRSSVCHITFNYSVGNCLGPTDLVNKYVKIVNDGEL